MKKKSLYILIVILGFLLLAVLIYAKPQGYIKIDTSGVTSKMKIRTRWWHDEWITSEGEPVAVRVRTYWPKYIELKTKKDRAEWTALGYGPWGKLAKIKVNQGKTTVLKLGPPLIVRADVRPRGIRNISIGLSILGQAGERYSRVTKNGKHMPAPTLKIVDESGKILSSGKFEYG